MLNKLPFFKPIPLNKGYISYFLILLSGFVSIVNAQITGTVFRDFNANGVKDNSATYNEIGVGGVTVKCVGTTGTGTTTTSSAAATLGQYTLSGCTGTTRVEFTWTQTGDYSGASGTGNNTSVQFVTSTATNVNFGINYPADYCQTNPNVMVPVYFNGNPLNEISTTKALLTYAYSESGDTPALNIDATQGKVGTVHGIAYNRQTKKAYLGAFLKRHTGLGPYGIGGIYQADYSSGSPVVTSFLDLEALGVDFGSISSNAARGLMGLSDPNQDVEAFAKVLKNGMGDLDISDDGNKLYVTNLFLRNITVVDLTAYNKSGATITAANLSTISLPVITCTNGVERPFGLKYYRDNLYASITCTAESGGTLADLVGYVYKWNGTTWTSQVTVPINLPLWGTFNPTFATENPVVWSDDPSTFTDANPAPEVFAVDERQPMVADIEFDVDGSMIIGILDRTAIQFGHFNYYPGSTSILQIVFSNGDMLRASYNGSTYTMESGGVVGGVTGCGAGTGNTYPYAGPGGGEFYCGDTWNMNHVERSLGSFALLPGSGEILSTAFDPNSMVNTGGVIAVSNGDGSEQDDLVLYNSNYVAGVGTVEPGSFSKGHGLGDLELLCDPAPLEIGNRVWLDTDKDGIQDPDEAGIDGVTVTLMIGSEMVTTITATVNGQAGVYYFKDGTGLPPAWGGIIPRNAVAKLFVADTYISGATTYKATVANVGTNDAIDSDGINMASQGTTAASVRIDFNTGFAGQNNHTYDFGYNVDTLMNFLNCAEVSAQDQTDIDSTPSDGTGDEYACATTTKTVITYDWGDNPDTGAGSGTGNYLTSSTDNGPRHQIVTGLKLGATVDAETDGQGTGTTSTGDDTNGVPDDEDGVTLPTFTEGVATPLNFTLMNMTGAVAKLCGWIDFNKDGVYDNTTERQCTNVADLATTATLTFTAPAGTAGTTYARFRLSTDAAFITAMDPTGVATSGEVEDYQATITAAPIFDLALDKKLSTGQATTVNAGDLVSFDITVYNQGSVDATAISITDYVDLTKFDAFAVADNPTGNSTVTVLPYTWSAAGVATLTGTLPMGASLKIPVKLRIKAGATGTAVNKAEISAATGGTDIDSTPDGTDGNQAGEVLPVMVDDQVTGNGTTGGDEDDHDLAQVTINVPLTADLELIKIADKTQVRVGDLLTYTLQITNKGPGTATAVKVKDTLPIGVSLQGSPVASVGTFDSATGIWTVGDMLNGSTATLTITVVVQ